MNLSGLRACLCSNQIIAQGRILAINEMRQSPTGMRRKANYLPCWQRPSVLGQNRLAIVHTIERGGASVDEGLSKEVFW